MKTRFLKGLKSEYFFFSDEEEFLLSKSKFSLVYLGANIYTKEKVICKQLSPALFGSNVERLKFIVEAGFSVNHPGFAKNIDLVVEDTDVFIIQEFIYGRNLKSLIKDQNYYEIFYNTFFYRIIISVLDSLSFLHKNGYCHCDIKPSNIMVQYDENGKIDFNNPIVKIIDFGSVKKCYKFGEFDKYLRTFNIMYASPEQIFGFTDFVGDHSDIFSTGLVLYEALTKEPAMKTNIPLLMRQYQATAPVTQHYRLDDDVFKIISKATAKPKLKKAFNKYDENELRMECLKSMSARFQSAEDFKETLKLLL